MIRIIIIRARHPGPYLKTKLIYNRRWIKRIGFGFIPCRHHLWFGLAIDVAAKPPKRQVKTFYKIDNKGRRYRISYHPITREPLD